MDRYRYFADEINSCLTMRDVLEKYHTAGKRNRTTCPIHHGDGNNFAYKGNVFHCWTCGAKGNVISFVMQLFHVDFRDAVKQLNHDFSIGLPISEKMTLRKKREFSDRRKRLDQQCLRSEREAEIKENIYDDIIGEWIFYDRLRREYAPKKRGDDFNPLYAIALHELPLVEYWLDTLC